MLKNIKFGYPEKELAINGINLNIIKGKLTAIVGKSGSGKTSTIDLILGLFQPSEGEILLDGINLNKFNLNSFRAKIGYVSQDPQLFNVTLKENLLWSAPEVTDKEIWEACTLANSDSFIKEFPKKLDTMMGDRGIRLSGGQRQRIALARALVRKPQILFLDEATSSLDSESENLIKESINKLSQEITVVVIAHRLSTISNSDYVYVLETGKVVEEGSYEELSKNSDSSLYSLIKEQGKS